MSLKTKIIAMYLPQFHAIPENDEWWGEGFTEWTTVRQSAPLWKNHNQPRVPKNNNYYNLLNKSTMQWQANIAANAGIYGFCFYHYYFENGRKVLEKPAENLLQWKDIQLPFCFSWANEPWIRTWSSLEDGNAWNPKFDANNKVSKTTNKTGVLINQNYGGPKEWEEHFYYLLPFFNDERYIKVDGKPVFLITRPEIIRCIKQMLTLWRKLAEINGLPGIYIVGSNTTFDGYRQQMDARYIYEPAYSQSYDPPIYWECRDKFIKFIRKYGIQFPHIYQYDLLWRHILKRKVPVDKPTYLGALVDFDDTPRRGKSARMVIGYSRSKFYKYLTKLIEKNESQGNEFIFLTAWNEWGEGAYLEPDEKNGYSNLAIIKKVWESFMNK